MEFKDFVDKCVAIFQEAKNKKLISLRVRRGRAGNCSSACEDLIAIGISEMIPQRYNLLVDYPLTVRCKDQKRAEMIYPDITILSGDKLIGLIEVKNDLGYMSEDWERQNREKLETLQKAELITYRKNVNAGVKEPKIPIVPVKKLDQIIIVITGKNDHDKTKLLNLHTCFILMPSHHPNHLSATKNIPEIIKNESGWHELKKYLTEHYI